jgi:hypothetical protein
MQILTKEINQQTNTKWMKKEREKEKKYQHTEEE